MTGTLSLPVGGEKNTTADAKVLALLKQFNELLDSSNKIPGTSLAAAAGITAAQLASAAKPVTGYTAKAIATEQTRESATFGKLTTADEITGVVVPENGILMVGFAGLVKSSVAAAGRVAVFLEANQLKRSGSVQEVATSGTAFFRIVSEPAGLKLSGEGAFGTTGETLGGAEGIGGFILIPFIAAGTYAVSIQFKATSGSVTAKERKLWAEVHGIG
jgi:hypothetical protein